MRMKNLLRDLTPPILWRSASRLLRALTGASTEQPAEFYDRAYETREHWKAHYADSHYYPLWTVIADRIRAAGLKRILDIGCGPGQVACLLRDSGVPEYTGLDFSTARIARARAICPEYQFVTADVFENDLLETYPYDCVLMTEFLEHVERDIDVLKRVRPGTTVLATVPNFPAEGHVRHFTGVTEVEGRYGSLLSQLDITGLSANKRGTTYYVLQGTR